MESVMKRTTATSFLSTCAISLALFSSCTSVEPNTLTPEEIADGWQLLFDGKTLNGWKDYNGTTLTQPWHVVDGCIQAKGDLKRIGSQVLGRLDQAAVHLLQRIINRIDHEREKVIHHTENQRPLSQRQV